MIERQRVKPGLDIGKVLQEKRSHIGIDLIAIRYRQTGTGATLRSLSLLAPRGLGEPAQGKTVSDVPGDARQLASTISNARDKMESGLSMRLARASIAQRILGSPQTLVPYFAATKPGWAHVRERVAFSL